MPPKPIPLTQGSYEARSLVASAQRCINLYPEKNPEDSVFPYSFYPVPGLVTLASPGAPAPGRGLYLASNNTLFMAAGSLVYIVDPTNWGLTAIGELQTSVGPVYFKDNGAELLVADGSGKCYSCELASPFLRPVHDVNCIGSTGVDLIDGFFLLNQPASRNWYTSLDNEVSFDLTFVAAKNGDSDLLQRVVAVQRMAWLIGERTSEIWFDAGNTDGMSFSITPGPFIQHGTPAPHSVAKFDLAVYWLGQSPQGERYVMMGQDYQTKKISTPAVDWAMSQYDYVADAVGFTYSQNGHAFYVLSFPTADATWVYDITQSLWHERVWTDRDGGFHRIRPLCAVSAFGKIIGVDWESGALYEIKQNVFTDTNWSTEPSDSGPSPTPPTPTPDNEIRQLFTPVAANTETAQQALVDWDGGVVYTMMTRGSDAANGLYRVGLADGVLQAQVSQTTLLGAQAGLGPAGLNGPKRSLAIANTGSKYCQVFEIDPVLLNVKNSFGVTTSSLLPYDPAKLVKDPISLAYVSIGTEADTDGNFIVTGSTLSGEGKVLTVYPNSIFWAEFDFLGANADMYVTAGPWDQNSAVVYCANMDHAGPFSNPVKLYKLTISRGAEFAEGIPYCTFDLFATINPTDIDPSWSTIASFSELCYDATDGNVIASVSTNDAVTHTNYLVKILVSNGVVNWAIPTTSAVINKLSQCRVTYGVLAVWYTSSLGHISIVAIDTILGTVLNTFTFTGISAGSLMHDDTTGLLVATGQYDKTATGNQILPVGSTPNSFGGSPGLDGDYFSLVINGDKLVGGSQSVPGGGSGGSTPRGSFPVPGATIPNQMTFLRSFPHIVNGGSRIILNAFWMKLDGGNQSAAQAAMEPAVAADPPTMSLRYSVDGGRSYGQPIPITLGATGQFTTSPTWRRLGLSPGRDVVFEVSWSGAACAAVLGAWLDATGLDT